MHWRSFWLGVIAAYGVSALLGLCVWPWCLGKKDDVKQLARKNAARRN